MAKILVAGQDMAALDIIVAEIGGQGHEVIMATNGQDAYDLVLSEQPDMVFLEANMPIFDGPDTCHLLRADPEVPASLPIVLIKSEEIDIRTIERLRITAVLDKQHVAWQLQDMLARYVAAA